MTRHGKYTAAVEGIRGSEGKGFLQYFKKSTYYHRYLSTGKRDKKSANSKAITHISRRTEVTQARLMCVPETEKMKLKNDQAHATNEEVLNTFQGFTDDLVPVSRSIE